MDWHTEEEISEVVAEEGKDLDKKDSPAVVEEVSETKDETVLEEKDYRKYSDIPEKERKHYGI